MAFVTSFNWAYKWGFSLGFLGVRCISIWVFVFVAVEFVFEVFFYGRVFANSNAIIFLSVVGNFDELCRGLVVFSESFVGYVSRRAFNGFLAKCLCFKT